MTNYEKLKEWSIDDWVDSCVLTCEQCVHEKETCDGDCSKWVRKWLESEVEHR